MSNSFEYLSELGITVDHAEIRQDCKATFQWFPQKDKTKYNWLVEWMNRN